MPQDLLDGDELKGLAPSLTHHRCSQSEASLPVAAWSALLALRFPRLRLPDALQSFIKSYARAHMTLRCEKKCVRKLLS